LIRIEDGRNENICRIVSVGLSFAFDARPIQCHSDGRRVCN